MRYVDPGPPDPALWPWELTLVCCGHEAGCEFFDSYEAADAFRNSYIQGPGVNPHGYSGGPTDPGHQRVAILGRTQAANLNDGGSP